MPPNTEPVRRDREQTLQEDLVSAITQLDYTLRGTPLDEQIYPLLKEALNGGVDPNITTEDDDPILCRFACCGMLKCFEECLLQGADPTNKKPGGCDALGNAINASTSPEIVMRMVTLLLNHHHAQDLHASSALLECYLNGLTAVAEKILQKRPEAARKALRYAICLGNKTLVNISFENSSDHRQLANCWFDDADGQITYCMSHNYHYSSP